ncbi:MAG: hypothetical protein LBQ66_10015 [Planctomycetaceae bacterium]|jgi:GTPase SAR1 family protein|nr:hypothetical protein [Planctomycetaceae bacterium]
MTSRTEKIDAILASRLSVTEKNGQTITQLDNVRTGLRSIQKILPKIRPKIENDSEKLQLIENISKTVDDRLCEIDSCRNDLVQLKNRFERKTLNIGIVGQARQGKSTFIQSLTGLEDSEIPTGSQGHCTGAPSAVVYHDKDTTYAVLELFDERDFMDRVIRPYYERMKIGDPIPVTLDDFADDALPESLPDSSGNKATGEEFLKRLKFRQDNLAQYRELLKGGERHITKSEIRSYIAQEDIDGKKLCNWLAVKKATIYCRFPNTTQDIGKITICDTPGLGDFVSGAEEQLVKTVGDNLDFVLFLRRPDAVGAIIKPEDTNLYDLITTAFTELSTAEWSYFIVNKTPDNEKSMSFFEDQLKKSSIRTRKTIQVDCKKSEDVSACFEEIIDDITTVINICDNKLHTIRAERAKQLLAKIKDFNDSTLTKFIQPEKNAASEKELVEVQRKFGNTDYGLWHDLRASLDSVREEYDKATQERDVLFEKSLNELRDKLESEQWTITAEKLNDIPKGDRLKWFESQMSNIRRRVSELIENMSNDFGSRFDLLRKKTQDAFLDAGCLKSVQWETDSDETEFDWWDGLLAGVHATAEISEQANHKDVIERAIHRFHRSTLSFDEFLEPRIRPCLNCIDPGKPEAADYWPSPKDVTNTQKLVDILATAAQKAYSAACDEIAKLEPEPARALCAAIEKFIDYAFRESGKEQQWLRLYYDYRHQIWDFKSAELDRKITIEWHNAVNALKEACH